MRAASEWRARRRNGTNFLVIADVVNIKENVDRERRKFRENTQQSLRKVMEQHVDDILLSKEQEQYGHTGYRHTGTIRRCSGAIWAPKQWVPGRAAEACMVQHWCHSTQI